MINDILCWFMKLLRLIIVKNDKKCQAMKIFFGEKKKGFLITC